MDDVPARKAVIHHALRTAHAMGGDVLEFTITDPAMRRLLAARGFLSLGGYRLYLRGAGGTPFGDRHPEEIGAFWWNGTDPEDTLTW